jgi:hypothetical protein
MIALQQIPAEAASKTPMASWWIAHANAWFSTIATAWAVITVTLAGLRINRWEE